MRAIVFDQYGGPEVLHLAEVPDPVAGPGQVLVNVAAAAVNPADYKWRDGMFKDYVPLSFPHIVGYDVAGTVQAVGSGVTGFAVGDRVAAMLHAVNKGGYAERVAIDASSVAKISPNLDFATAAAIPCAGLTGTQMIEELIQAKPGETVLITGAIGAVGHFALFAAIRRGAHVVAAVRAKQAEEARAFGAADVIVLGEQSWVGAPFDHVCDTVGGEAVAALCRHVKPGGHIYTAATTPINPQGLSSEPQAVMVRPDGKRLQALAEDVAAGRLPVKIAHRLPLTRAAEAQRMMTAGGLGGKIILEP